MYSTMLNILVLCIFFCKTFGDSEISVEYANPAGIFRLRTHQPIVFPDVYWRHYTGIVPDDAVPGGHDRYNRTTYIGQGYITDKGIIPGIIYSGQNQITVPLYGIKVVDTYIKILCSSKPHTFKWLSSTSDLKSSLNKYLVPGGLEHNRLTYIGRLAFQGELITGKIITYSDYRKAIMFFNYRGEEKFVKSIYEILTVDPYVNITLPQPTVEPKKR